MDVNSIYGSTFSQGNTSSGHFQNTISSNTSTFFDAGNVMLPSPIYGAKELNYYLHQPQQQHSLQTQQEDTIISQIPTNIKQEISISHQNPPNELKPEYFSVQSELGMVTVPEAQRFYINYLEKNFNPHNISYPPTPTTPHNEKYLSEGFPIITPTELNVSPVVFNPQIITLSQQAEMFYEQGHYFLHVARPRNTTLAFSRFEAAASLGSNRGKHQLAYCLQHGIGVVKDEKKAVEIYLKIADDPPNPATLCQLGICFQMGIGVEVDASRAVQYYERAVLMGHTDAMFNLAYCLRCGIGTPVNPERACELYYRMAELGDPQGMKLLGNCKSIGLGTVKDEREALEWFRRSSESDIYWGGKIQYALHLFEGIGTVQNWFEAFNLIRDVCENFPLCPGPNKILLGRFYHFGIGCQVDFEKALYWYERALRSYYMQLCSVQECEMLINDIRNRQSQNSTMPMFLGGTGNEQMIGESAIRQDGNY